MTIRLSRAGFEERAATMTARFARLGDTEELVREEDDGSRVLVQWTIWAPNEVATLGRFEYFEVFEPHREEFEMTKYTYDFFDLAHDGRRGYHWHRLPGRGSSSEYHAHCCSPIPAEGPHYRHIPLLLEEAHSDFVRLYFADLGISCGDLRELI